MGDAPKVGSNFFVSAVFLIAWGFHLLLGLPAVSGYLAAAVFSAAGVALATFSTGRSALVVAVCVVLYLALPVAATVALAIIPLAQLYASSPGQREPSPLPADGSPTFIHVSDTHFLKRGLTHTFEGTPWDAAKLVELRDLVIRARPRYLLHSGDVTDAGSVDQWQQAHALFLKPIADAGIRIILAPGNHDLQPAFGGAPGTGSPDRGGAELSRRFLENLARVAPPLQTVRNEALTEKLAWRPSNEEVAARASEQWRECLAATPIGEGRGAAAAHARGCEIAAKPESVRETWIAFATENACADWFPLYHDDLDLGSRIVILCSRGIATGRIGENAVGALGAGQLERFRELSAQTPVGIHRVLVLMHHPPVKRWNDRIGLPQPWWSKQAWQASTLWNYAVLGLSWRDSVKLIDGIEAAQRNGSGPHAYSILFGHRHERSFSRISGDGWSVDISEAPAIQEFSSVGSRAAWPAAQAGAGVLSWKWIQ